MNSETQTIEYKSLQKIRTGDKGFKELSTTCVALANAQGGQIYVGYDDKKKHTLPGQTVSAEEINNAVTKLRGLTYWNRLFCTTWRNIQTVKLQKLPLDYPMWT